MSRADAQGDALFSPVGDCLCSELFLTKLVWMHGRIPAEEAGLNPIKISFIIANSSVMTCKMLGIFTGLAIICLIHGTLIAALNWIKGSSQLLNSA